jgi:hypothetical protein
MLTGVATILGSLLSHAALLMGIVSAYAALSSRPSGFMVFALLVALPIAVPMIALAAFMRRTRAGKAWEALMLVLLSLCAIGQFALGPIWACFASPSFCL